MSESADKARKELELIGEEPMVIDWYCRVIDEYYSIGHSGGSMFAALPVLVRLLKQENLSPLTNNPDEWYDQSEVSGYPLWQSKRNSEAFSNNGGITYYLLSEGGNNNNRKPLHAAVEHTDIEVNPAK